MQVVVGNTLGFLAHPVWRVGVEHGRDLATHEPRHIVSARRVAAQDAMVAHNPKVAQFRHRVGRWFRGFVLRDAARARQQVADLGGVEPGDQFVDAGIFNQVGQRLRQGAAVPLGKFGRPIVGDGVRGAVAALEVGLRHGDLLPV